VKHTIQLKFYALGAALLIALHVARVTAAEPITLPLLDDEAMIRVPVTLFGETRYFAVDTGAPVTIIDASYRARLVAPLRLQSPVTSVFETEEATSLSVPGVIHGRDSGRFGRSRMP
jgi:hypothetical protein